jgi:hypothetical protein
VTVAGVEDVQPLDPVRAADQEQHRALALPHGHHLARRQRKPGGVDRTRAGRESQTDDNRPGNRQYRQHEHDHQRHDQAPQPAQAGDLLFVFGGIAHGDSGG